MADEGKNYYVVLPFTGKSTVDEFFSVLLYVGMMMFFCVFLACVRAVKNTGN